MQVSASAKVILAGEHAVVYGVPAIAVPLSHLRTSVVVSSSDSGFGIYSETTGEFLDETFVGHPLVRAAVVACGSLDQLLPGVYFTVESDIPVASGLGSGAAVTVALIKAIYSYYGVSIDYTKLNSMVFDIERLHHGTPSGIDNTVIVYEKPVYFVRDTPSEFLSVGAPFQIIVADTGIAATTRETVAAVRQQYDNNRDHVEAIFTDIRQIVESLREAIEQGNPTTVGQLMTQNHKCLQKLGVSVEKLDLLVNAATNAGAYGAKLSGGGGGGNMIALTSQDNLEQVKTALLEAGAMRVFTSTLEPS